MLKSYLVGGAVRDELLGLTPKDQDYVVVGSSPEEMLSLGFRSVGKDFPVFLHPDSSEEYALARSEKKVSKGYAGFEFYTSPDVTIEQDLLRRDLTINAIAKDLSTGEIIDPYNGKSDLENKVIRHVSSAFSEDPLRVLRVARFFARYHHLGFTIAEETLSLMKELSKTDELNHLTPERVWVEMNKALGEKSPEKFFECLHETGALSIVLPEINALWGVPQPEAHHPEIDTGVHTMLALKQCASMTENKVFRFGTLVHDLGKAVTPKDKLPQHINHEDTGVPIVNNLCERLKAPKEYREFAAIICAKHTHIHRALDLTPKKLLETLKAMDFKRKPDRFAGFCIAAESDARGRTGFENRDYPQAQYLLNAAEAVRQVNMRDFDYTTEKGKQEAHNALLNACKAVKSEYKKSH